jgi:glutathione synthase/RimK-type ligase-like ATP-grasp enzyme
MKILVLGNGQDAHAVHIYQRLREAGVTVDYLDLRQFPTKMRMSWQLDTEAGNFTLPAGNRYDFSDIHSIFWRNLGQINVPTLEDKEQQRIADQDTLSTARSLLQSCPARWINSWQAYQFHQEKPLQLRAAKQLGVTIPTTLISNDPQEIHNFVQHQPQAIFKPVYGGAHAQLLTQKHLDRERLQKVLSISPVTIQAYIPGTNIRSYVIGESVYSAEIRTEALDFRDDQQAVLIPRPLPPEIEAQCHAIAQRFFLHWTAIDWRLSPTGEYFFLEANPSPMFLRFERQTGFPITDELVKLLMVSTDPR